MSKKEIWFRNGEGNEFSCNEGTVAFKLMTEDGAFTKIDGPGGKEISVIDQPAEEVKVPDAPKPTRAEIVAQAKELGLEFKGNAKNSDIQALIDAKLAEAPATADESVMVKFVLADQSIVEAVEGSEEFVALSNDHDVKRLYSDEDALAQNDGVDASTEEAA
jgi:hypothetical protein